MIEKESLKVVFGAFYTPKDIVRKAVEVLKVFLGTKAPIVLDLSAGEGAFLEELDGFDYRAGEIDEVACEKLKRKFDSRKVFCVDALKDVSREKYDIPEDAYLVVVGNPPYNDWTSLYRKGRKGRFEMDRKVFDRDLGIAFMKAIAELRADLVCLLHPMSYLIKKANFNRLRPFLSQYRLLKAIAFPSFVFSKKRKGFPILIACYERDQKGFSWAELLTFEFEVEDKVFRLKDLQTTDGFIRKYPIDGLSSIGLYFHTFRDINSIIRNRDFLLKPTKNTIPIELEDFPKYAYLVALKHYILSKGIKNFWFYGNFSPLVDKEFFTKHYKDFVAYALEKTTALPQEMKERLRNLVVGQVLLEKAKSKVENYFDELFSLVWG